GNPSTLSDIYSLGLTLYELLTLRPAFDEVSRSALLRAVAQRDPTPPRRLNSHIPRDLETIVLKSMEREESHRYAAARELANDLGRYLAGEPIEARRVTSVERVRKWARRRPLVAGLTSALAFLFCVAFALVTWQWRSAESARRESELRTEEAQHQKNLAEASLEDAIEARYRSGISRVDAISRTAPGVAGQLLASLTPSAGQKDYRGWEWGYLKQVGSQASMVMQCGSAEAPWIRSLAFSPDESMLAVGACRTGFSRPEGVSPQGRVTLWDLRRGDLVQEFPINDSGWSVAISGDNRLIAICDTRAEGYLESAWGGPTQIWDVESAKRLTTLEMPTAGKAPSNSKTRPTTETRRVQLLQFFEDDQFLAGTAWTVSETPVASVIWDTRDGAIVWSRPKSEILTIDEAKGTILIADYADRRGDRLKRLNLKTKSLVEAYGSWRHRYVQPSEDFVLGLELPNARYRPFLEQLSSGKRVLLWGDDQYKTAGGHMQRPVNAVHPNAKKVAIGATDGTVRIWQSQTGELDRILHGHSIDVQCVTYSDSGSWLASGDWSGQVRVWRPEYFAHEVTCHPLGLMPAGCLLEDIAFRFDGTNLVGSGVIFDQGTYGDQNARAHVSSWEPSTGTRLRDIRVPPMRTRDRCRTAQFGPNGELLASVTATNMLRIVDFESGETVFEKHCPSSTLYEVALGDGGDLLAVSMSENPVVASDGDGEGDGKLTDRILLYEVDSNHQMHEIAIPRSGTIALSPISKMLAFACSEHQDTPASRMKVFRLDEGQSVDLAVPIEVTDSGGRVSAIRFSPQNELLAVAWENGILGIFDMAGGEAEPIIRDVPSGIEDL
ncbi:MAG: hypothetical protein AAGG44_17100, partial [Planctomycetota bacterium]